MRLGNIIHIFVDVLKPEDSTIAILFILLPGFGEDGSY
jgi:hypothetical protein